MDCAATRLVMCCCPSLQACALRQAHTRQDAASSEDGQTATAGSDTRSSSQGDSAPSNSGPEASSGSRPVRRQQQRTGRGLQRLPQASGSVSGSAATVAAGPASAATPAAPHSSRLAKQQPVMRKPYSHFVCTYSQLKPEHTAYIAIPLCTEIEELQGLHGSCSVEVSFCETPS